MSLVAPPGHSVHFAEPTRKKENRDSASHSVSPKKVSNSTVLIATVQEDEPLVTRKELWSYYRVSSPREFHTLSLLTRT